MKNGLSDFAAVVEELERRLLDVAVEEGNADDAFLAVDHGRVDVLAVDLEVFRRRLAGLAGQRALGHLLEHRAQLRIHVGEPGRVGVGVGVEVIEAAVLHHVVALGVGQRVVGLAEVPLAGEVGLVAALLQHRGQRPFRRRQSAALALEGHGGHAAAVRDAPGLHRGAARRAARLGVEREEGHALVRHPVDVRRRHAAPLAAAVGTEVAVAGVVGHDEEDVGLARLRVRAAAERHDDDEQNDDRRAAVATSHLGISFLERDRSARSRGAELPITRERRSVQGNAG